MAEYVTLGVNIDPDTLRQRAYDAQADANPGWEPSEGDPFVRAMDEITQWAADNRYLLTLAADDIFRFFGKSLMGIEQTEAVEATAVGTITATDTIGHTIEVGTQIIFTDSTGENVAFEVAEDVEIPAASYSTGAGEVELRAVDAGESGNAISGSGQFVDAFSWVDYAEIVGVSTGGSDEETPEDYLDKLKQKLALVAPRAITAEDLEDFARDVSGVYRAMARDLFNPVHNLLSANAASFEVDVTDWNNTTNCAITQSGAQFKSGSASMRMRSAAAGDMVATHDFGLSGIPVTAGERYTASVYTRAAVSARNVQAGINWYDSGGTIIGATHYGTAIANSDANFNSGASVTEVAPATAVYGVPVVKVVGTGAANEDHYVDEVQLRNGASSSPWVAGGTPAENNTATASVAVMGEDGTALPDTSEVLSDLQSRVLTGFDVYVVGPDLNTVDVDYIVRLFDDADESETLESIDAAIADYLAPENWGIPVDNQVGGWEYVDYVYRFELATLISNNFGVDRLLSLEINGSSTLDAKLFGPFPTTEAGTITGAAA